MVAVPAVPPVVIMPDVVFITATAILLLDQVPPATVDANVVVPPIHIVWLPLKVPALGAAAAPTVNFTTIAGPAQPVAVLVATAV